MMDAVLPADRRIERVEQREDGLYLYSKAGLHRLMMMGDACVRITYTGREAFSQREKPGVVCKGMAGNAETWHSRDNDREVVAETGKLRIVIDKKTASYTYYCRNGKLLLKERGYHSKTLEEFQSYLPAAHGARTEKVETPDGVKELVREAAREPGEKLYHTRLWLDWQEGEALYGLGQQEEGNLNLRGHTVYLHQANRKIAIPMLVSSLGYGILMDTYSPMIFNDTEFGSYLYTEADDEMDYYFMAGADLNEVVREYRRLTGKAAMLPRWAFGYLQSQERYETAEELVQVAEEYRKRGIGLDGIVLDWLSWGDGLWGQKTFDPERFPDPKNMIDALHKKDVHFMISIWPNMDERSDNYKEMKEHGGLLPASNLYNALDETARSVYWKQVREGLNCHGVDAWWCDSSEPITPEWGHNERVEPSAMYEEYCREMQNHLPMWALNAYCLYHARAIYEGQRAENDGVRKAQGKFHEKRVCNLTRSAYTGQQRYGTILWSGDISASWDTLRRQIAEGLSFCACGLPYWTTDIGAFFVKKSVFWYWDGDYPDAEADMGYQELFTRWYQWGAFLPVFRGHGTDCRRELWNFKGHNGMFYDAMLKANRLRYCLMPYIYSQAGRVWLEDASMIKLLAFDFAEDSQVLDIKDEYMFGDSLLVCPVTEPMYYLAGSRPIENASYTKKVYLPRGCGWYDFWTEKYYSGGIWIEAEAPIDRIPLFVKEGGILPIAVESDRTVADRELDRIQEWRIYSGRDGQFRLYEDAGDGYGYEQGKYTSARFYWSEKEQRLADNFGRVVPAKIIRHSAV